MKYKTHRIFIIGLLLLLFTFVLISCGSNANEPASTPETVDSTTDTVADTTEDEHQDEHEEEAGALEGDPVRGGLLYDKWWTVQASTEEHEHEGDDHEASSGAPEGDHPLWASQDTNTRSGSDTWRCKECHGWDYKGVDGAYGSGSHMTGFVGVIQLVGSDPNEVLAAMKGATNPDHDFSTYMTGQDLIDLSLFISQAVFDYNELINDDKSAKGDAATGATRYGEVCMRCHGPQGNAINFSSLDDPEFLGHLAPDNPWEFVHKVRFGQPGWPMPSAIVNGWSNQDVANVLAYVQSFSAEPFLSGGGQLYDNWWVVMGVDEPTGDQPLWATQNTNERSGTDTWRCKECHGWDYLGAEGAYSSGSHFTGFTGVLSAASMSADELLGWLDGSTNPDHDFSAMGEPGLNAMVAFMQNEMADITPFVNADKTVSGDPANGKGLFEGTCAACHGVDGKKINFHDADDPEYVGTVAADNPWEFFHKASFGQPGAPMPSGLALGWSMQEIADLLSYVQTLPTE